MFLFGNHTVKSIGAFSYKLRPFVLVLKLKHNFKIISKFREKYRKSRVCELFAPSGKKSLITTEPKGGSKQFPSIQICMGRYEILISMIRRKLWQSFKNILHIGFRATLNFENFKVALNPIYRFV